MRNRKGFVMTETLVVTVFLVTIFTFIYVSIVPLLGSYEDMTYRNSDIDIVYKLYNIRKMFNQVSIKGTITSNTFKEFNCSIFTETEDVTYCNKMMEFLELRDGNTNKYSLVYADNVYNRLSNFQNISSDPNKEIYDYISKYDDFEGRVLVLLDKKKHTVAHLAFK